MALQAKVDSIVYVVAIIVPSDVILTAFTVVLLYFYSNNISVQPICTDYNISLQDSSGPRSNKCGMVVSKITSTTGGT